MRPPSFSVAINSNPGKGEAVALFSGNGQTEPVHKVGPQVLDYYLVHYVVSGQGSFHCMGRDYELGPGDSFFIFPGELVSYASDAANPWFYRWIGFKGTQVDQLLSSIGISPHKPVVSTSANRRVPVLFHHIQKVFQQGNCSCDMQAGGYLRLLFAEYAKKSNDAAPGKPEAENEMQQQVSQAIRWLTLQYSQPISIENMAQTLGYHRTHLSKIFKQHTGMSPINFLLKIRMERARLLLNEPLTIEQIASSVGFTDALYFSKQFKKWFGCSPSEFRSSASARVRFDCSQSPI